VWLLSHSDLLTQVLSNLLSNALKYSCGAVEVSVYVQDGQGQIQNQQAQNQQAQNQQAQNQQAQNTVTVNVRDYGEGVPDAVLTKLTTPFFRVQDNRAKGWGLGLALSEHIVRSLEGEITFHNLHADSATETARGFLAQVTLPLYDES
jgi:signal transduction histidine kinase